MKRRNESRLKFGLIILLSMFLISACSSTKPGPSGTVAALISGMPADNSDEETRINRELINSGAAGILSICNSLVPPGTGDDAGARFALSSLTHFVQQSGMEDERLMFSKVLIDALNNAEDNEVKAFLIRRLQYAGGDEAVTPLGKYLADERLCEPAAQALLAISSKGAESQFINALPMVKGRNLVTIINALGILRSKAAGYELIKYIASENSDVRAAVLFALGNIGPVTPEALLYEASRSESLYERSKAVTNLLTYARRLAESGMVEECAKICRNLVITKNAPGEENIQVAALTLLAETSGESALWDLLSAIDSPSKDVRLTAIELANKIPGTNTTIELLNKLQTLDKERQTEIQAALMERDKKYSTPALEEAIKNWPDADGFVWLFNGKDLTGWKGLVGNPLTRAEMTAEELADAQAKADEVMREHWKIEDGVLVFDGEGSHLCTARDYGDFEMLVDWKIGPEGDSGIYLRGSPQVQIWDIAQWPEGSGGLYNNQNNPGKPLKVADNPIGEWNNLRIRMTGDKVTVWLNDVLVVDNVVMENYWDREQPIFPTGQIELQSHGSNLYFKNIKIKELSEEPVIAEDTEPELEDGFVSLFNGEDLTGWVGDKTGYVAEDGKIVVHPEKGGGSGNLYTEKEYNDFIFRFEFRLTPGANNGLGIRAPLEGDAAYVGMELQILDNTADIYKDLKPWQYHGSIYGIVAAKKGYLKTVGSWNYEEVIVKGRRVTVMLNDVMIVDADIDEASKNGTIDGRNHPGLKREKGHIGFLGHGSRVEFRNIRIKEIK